MAGSDAVTQYVAPALGMLIANVMFFSPLLAVLQVRKNGHLGALNPLPFPLILGNCCSWLAYSLLTHDWFLFFGNLPGIHLGLFFVLSTIVHAKPQTRRLLEAATLVMAFDIAALCASMSFSMASLDVAKFAWGLNSNIVLMIYYGAPLSAVVEVFRTRSSSTLYWPTCIANFVNGALWFTYGLWGVKDYWLWVPNGIGACLAGFQLALCWVFPRGVPDMKAAEDAPEKDVECLPGKATEDASVGHWKTQPAMQQIPSDGSLKISAATAGDDTWA